jgi:hypothetical protein
MLGASRNGGENMNGGNSLFAPFQQLPRAVSPLGAFMEARKEKSKRESVCTRRLFEITAVWELMNHGLDNGTDGPLFGLAGLRITLAEPSVMAVIALPEMWPVRIA